MSVNANLDNGAIPITLANAVTDGRPEPIESAATEPVVCEPCPEDAKSKVSA